MEDILRILDPSCSAMPSLMINGGACTFKFFVGLFKVSHFLFVYFIGHEKSPITPQGIKAQCFNYTMPINANKFHAKDLCCTSAKSNISLLPFGPCAIRCPDMRPLQ